MAKAAYWTITDAEARKRGEQTGLDTLVVHAVYTGRSQAAIFGEASLLGARAYWAPGWPVLSRPVR